MISTSVSAFSVMLPLIRSVRRLRLRRVCSSPRTGISDHQPEIWRVRLSQCAGVPLCHVLNDLRLLCGLSVSVELDAVAAFRALVLGPDDVFSLVLDDAAVRGRDVDGFALARPRAGDSVWRAPRLGLRELVEAQKRGNGRRVAVGPA